MANLFRRLLVEIRRRQMLKFKKTLLVLIGATIGTVALSFAVDYFTPYEGVWMILRSAWLVPTAVAIFSLGYFGSILLHNHQVEKNPDWRAFRARYSQRSRFQIAVVCGSALLLGVYITPKDLGYTALSSLIGAGILAVMAFIRVTSAEYKRQQLGIPDARDVKYDYHERLYLEKKAQERADRQEAKKKKKESK